MKDFKKYITDKKEISAGFLFETPEGFLLVHPTARAKSKGNWDIPKGHIETGEYPLEAAIRELKEETGLDYNPDWETDFLGQFNYTLTKDLLLYHLHCPVVPDVKKCKCTSYFDLNGKETPENDDFMITKELEYTFHSMQKILKKLGLL